MNELPFVLRRICFAPRIVQLPLICGGIRKNSETAVLEFLQIQLRVRRYPCVTTALA